MKHIIDLTVVANERLNARHVLLRLTHKDRLPRMIPGQFVEVRVDGSPTTFLRRPISVNFVDEEANELWLLVAMAGDGTRRLATIKSGELLNCLLPLGNGFSMPQSAEARHLLVGGGVGVAPLLYLGKKIHDMGGLPTFLLGARTADDLLMIERFEKYGRVLVTTEDGSLGERGFVTNHSVLRAAGARATVGAYPCGSPMTEHFDFISSCGPKPMMVSIARYAKEHHIPCEVSLENMMACGIGACLCCVEKTVKGNLCVCKDGPVFNIDDLTWLT